MYLDLPASPRSAQPEPCGNGRCQTDYPNGDGKRPRLHVEHGVELDGERYPFGGSMQFRTCQPGEFLPPLRPDARQPVPDRALHVSIANETYRARNGDARPVPIYYCRFESLFGQRWETRNPADPQQPPDVMPLGH